MQADDYVQQGEGRARAATSSEGKRVDCLCGGRHFLEKNTCVFLQQMNRHDEENILTF